MIGFKLYSIDVRDLVDHITTKINDRGLEDKDGTRIRYEHADFDVDDDGNITVHVEGKEALRL